MEKEKKGKEVEKHLEKISKETHEHDPILNQIVYWSSITVVIIANLLASIILIPFLTVLNRWFLDIIVVVIGLTIGALYNLLIIDLGHIEKHHRILASIIVPALAAANVFIMVLMSNNMSQILAVNTPPKNPITTSLLFGIAFIIPYIIDSIRKSKGKKPLLSSKKE